jgi:pyruvate dehydrogenase E2 component (dihydrolipoamide acetyltransferase)
MTATAGDTVPVAVPDIGDFDGVPVIEILVSVGDTVAAEDPLVTLESDKATMDVPAPFGGTVKAIHVKVGDSVAEGALLLDLERADGDSADADGGPDAAAKRAPDTETADETKAGPTAASPGHPSASQVPVEAPKAAEAPAKAADAPAPVTSNGSGPIYASPSVRRLARELGVDLHGVSGSGRKGRITPEDVRSGGSAPSGGGDAAGGPAATAGAGVPGLNLAPWPKVDFEKFGPVERVARTRIQRISAPNLARNWVMIPHVTHNDEADITELESWRKQLNAEQSDAKVTMVSFLVLASVATLKAFPDFNSSLDGEELVLRKYWNIGFAADTPGGLVVPVIKNADKKGLLEVAAELTELSSKARAGKLQPGDISGSTFTISSLGGIGGTSFTPIINAPEVAILGATRSQIKPVWNSKESAFEPRLLLPLSLSYDHRVVDGAAAARFVAHLAGILSDFRRVLL